MGALAALLLAGLWPVAPAMAQTGTGSAHVSHPRPNEIPQTTPGLGNTETVAPVPASNPRVQKLDHKLMCMCGCNSILVECDHQGSNRCLMHDQEMAELERRVASGESNSLILQSFVQEYGPQVLVVPPARGFDLTAWLMPIFASLFGLSIAIIVVQRWRDRELQHAAAPAAPTPPVEARADLIERARRETEDEDFS
jgi:cytochrome c-type biogenesis protein CcmH